MSELKSNANGTITNENQVQADLGFNIVAPMRDHTNYTLGLLLTIIDGALGDTMQCKAIKNQIKREMYALTDRNQAEVYEYLGVQKRGLAPKEVHIGEDYEDLE